MATFCCLARPSTRFSARRTVVLPLFFSPNEPLLALVRWRSRERDPGRLVVLSFALPYALVVGLYARSYQRFLLPLLPFLALLLVWVWWEVRIEFPVRAPLVSCARQFVRGATPANRRSGSSGPSPRPPLRRGTTGERR